MATFFLYRLELHINVAPSSSFFLCGSSHGGKGSGAQVRAGNLSSLANCLKIINSVLNRSQKEGIVPQYVVVRTVGLRSESGAKKCGQKHPQHGKREAHDNDTLPSTASSFLPGAFCQRVYIWLFNVFHMFRLSKSRYNIHEVS